MKNSNLKIMFMLLTLATFVLCLSSCNQSGDISDEIVRIHIRANSNLDVDQAVKLDVRDSVTAYLQEALEGCNTKQESLDCLSAHLDTICEIADSTLAGQGFDYSSTATLGTEYFEERTYDNTYTVPAGEYDSLIVNLGTGTGDNWWCIAFPPLCFSGGSDTDKVVYKSWIKEKLDKIFDKN